MDNSSSTLLRDRPSVTNLFTPEFCASCTAEQFHRATVTMVIDSWSDSERAYFDAISSYHHIPLNTLVDTPYSELIHLYNDIPTFLR